MGEILGIGVAHYPGLITEIVDRIKTCVFDSSKGFALPPSTAQAAQTGRA